MSYVDLDEEHKEKFEKLMSTLEALDDVDVVYHNASNV
jgi:transcriptional/translational regulatory protein YebC/TACO1